ncbi:hypothetical protein EE612_039843 [Oryza sativa]|nr:hypothetical protein EE612_039843 [Oryza sativa]
MAAESAWDTREPHMSAYHVNSLFPLSFFSSFFTPSRRCSIHGVEVEEANCRHRQAGLLRRARRSHRAPRTRTRARPPPRRTARAPPSTRHRRLLLLRGRRRRAASTGNAASVAVVEEGVGGGGSGRKVCNGGGGEGRDGRCDADVHCQRMIQADPTNPLLLGNYARFLKKVERDAARAQEYCEHAIVANPGDGDALALYAGLVWETTRDTDRTDAYFTRGRGPATARPPPPSRLLDVAAP